MPFRCLLLLLPALLLRAAPSLSVEASGCVYRVGDNPEWSKADLDESAWTPVPPQGTPLEIHLWKRCRLHLRNLARTGPVYVQSTDRAAWEMFADGVPIGTFGNLGSGRYSMDLAQRRVLPEAVAARPAVTVALRETRRIDRPRLRIDGRMAAGAEATLAGETLQQSQLDVSRRMVQLIAAAFIGAAGFCLLILCRVENRRELFWLGVVCLCFAAVRVNELAELLRLPYPLLLNELIWNVGPFAQLFQVFFFFALVERRVPLFYRVLVWVGVGFNIVTLLSFFAHPETAKAMTWWSQIDPSVYLGLLALATVASTGPLVAFWPPWRIPRELRGVAMVSFCWIVSSPIALTTQLAGLSERAGVLAFNFRAVAMAPAVVGMFFLLAQRQRRIVQDQAELRSEMQAAQEMQRMLVPASLDVQPWLSIDVAYFPAKEVGGDFYFCRRVPQGELVVIGDVSGKGIKAAMMAAAMVGALRNQDTFEPAQVLARLNTMVLHSGSGGFVTCLCGLFQRDGLVQFANAGHLSPYAHGAELEVMPALPLGIDGTMEYETAQFQLAAGDSITLLSDGVLEAKNGDQELFGFTRTGEVSTLPAMRIAETARAFGQDDDITVLTACLRI